jgi:dTDP-4-dehydrorhamnose 3,5-epimerase
MIKNKISKDNRGFFLKLFTTQKANYKSFKVNQSCLSYTKKKGTIRGMHYQEYPNYEKKIVTCVKGKIFDVVLDVRKNSKTFLKYKTYILDAKKNNSIIVKKGFAHGYQTLQDNCWVFYNIDQKYKKNKQRVILWNDIRINIKWPLRPKNLSKKDRGF